MKKLALLLFTLLSMQSLAASNESYKKFMKENGEPILLDLIDPVGNKVINRNNKDELYLHCLERLEQICIKAAFVTKINSFGIKEYLLVRGVDQELKTVNLAKIDDTQDSLHALASGSKVFDNYDHLPLEHTALAFESAGESIVIAALVPFAIALDVIKLPIDIIVHSSNFIERPFNKLRAKRIFKTLIGDKRDKKVTKRYFDYLINSIKDHD